MLHHRREQLRPFDAFPLFDPKRGSRTGNFFRKRFLIHIYARADDHVMDKVRLRAHFRENTAYLFPGDHHIVRPLDSGIKPQLSHRPGYGKRHHQREHACLIRRTFRAQQKGKIQVAALR